jgi:glycosyltransferase involved in cell wall biosynthesis
LKYPRVLIVAIGRINAADTSNNGLLLRNLFGKFPRENLAQIYSGGENGDDGFFGHYYRLGPKDRMFGRLFFRLKRISQEGETEVNKETGSSNVSKLYATQLGTLGKRLLMDSGLYELIFRPRFSQGMLELVENFRPDIIFTQGYNLTFTWLPMMLARRFHLPIAYYPADDWPDYCYRPDMGHKSIISRLVRNNVENASRQLVEYTSIRLAFNKFMKEEYLHRYGYEFTELMQGDDYARFKVAQSQRSTDHDKCLVVCTGHFDSHRLPLLDDLEKACEILNANGVNIHATVFPVNELSELTSLRSNLRYVHFEVCPSHDGLVSVLRGADILFLPERFGKKAGRVRLSVSSKAHLFMFSGRPIVVYSDPITGIARYAKEEGWATVVEHRDPQQLADTLERLINDENERQRLIISARNTAMKNHHLPTIQDSFHKLLCSSLQKDRAAVKSAVA